MVLIVLVTLSNLLSLVQSSSQNALKPMFMIREGVLGLGGGMNLCVLLGFSKMESKFGALANYEGSQDRWLLKGLIISSGQAYIGFEM